MILGIKIGENFNHPLSSKSVTEFWRKWHISLGNWLRDYVYNPILFANKKWGNRAIYFSLFITFFICGVWHGAKWNYVIFGCLQAVALILEAMLAKRRKAWANSSWRKLYLSGSWLLTFLFIYVSDVFFRTETTHEAWHILQSVTSTNWMPQELWDFANYITKPKLAISLLLLLMIIIADKPISHFAIGKSNFGRFGNLAVTGFLLACVILLGYWGQVVFLYFQF